jgi:hypothetical protein
MRDAAYGFLLPVGLFAGLAVGLAVGEPSLGTVVGLGAGGLLAILLQVRPRR